jgi:hypothetical protein
MERAQRFLTSIFGSDDEPALSRRDALAGLGLGALLVATAKFVAPSAAQGKPLDQAAGAAASSAPETKTAENQAQEHAELNAAESSDATDLSSRRYWRRRHYWRRPWRRRHWRRRYYWRRPWRRRYWRRRYWRRRYWW